MTARHARSITLVAVLVEPAVLCTKQWRLKKIRDR